MTIFIVCPGYVATEIDDKKMLGDGSVEPVELNVDKSKYMPADVSLLFALIMILTPKQRKQQR